VRVLKLWRLYAWMDLTWILQDPITAVTYFISDLFVNLTLVVGALLLAERFDGIGSWSRDQVVFMLGYAILVRGIVDGIFGFNIAFISRRIGRGQLDHVLIQPQSFWLALLVDGFTPFSGLTATLPGLVLMVLAGQRLSIEVSPGWLGLFGANVLGSLGVILAFSFLWGSLAFWSPRGAEEISSSAMRMIDQLKPFPLDGVAPLLLGGLLTVVPAGFVAWYPVRALLGIAAPLPTGLVTPAAALGFLALTILVYRKGMRHYGYTGSQRYHSMGHRR